MGSWIRIRIRSKVKSRIQKRFNPLGAVELTMEPWRLTSELMWLTMEPRRLIVEPLEGLQANGSDTQHFDEEPNSH
jgi:hypothetical protein